MSTSNPRIIIPGEVVTKVDAFVFRCPECNKLERFDDAYEPMCTGPSPSRDEHTMTLMVRLGRG